MDKICTSVEQSQKLIELGVDINTADMYWLNRHIDLTETKYEMFVVDRSNEHIDFFNSYAVAVEKGEIIPAWSLNALMELTPNDVSLLHLEDVYQAVYDVKPYHVTNRYDNPLDAIFETIVWLKENGKL